MHGCEGCRHCRVVVVAVAVAAWNGDAFGRTMVQCSEVGQDLCKCRLASIAPSATGCEALADQESWGRRNRGIAVACIDRAAIV